MKTQQPYGTVRSMMYVTSIAVLILILSTGAYAKGNVVMRGALVVEPCVIAPGDETIQLDFRSIVDKYLYLNQRTPGQELRLQLSECDLNLGNTVRITFSGTENQELPGLLAIDAGSQASGIAIGLETLAGEAIPFNKSAVNYNLGKGSNIISIKAYIKGEPKALAQRTIKFGGFNAAATFSLEYE